MTDFIVVYVTVASSEEGQRIARALVEERLAACVNLVKGVESIYRWQGKVEQSQEELLVIKSKQELFSRLRDRVKALHSYTVPEIVALPVLEGGKEYLQWWAEQLQGQAS